MKNLRRRLLLLEYQLLKEIKNEVISLTINEEKVSLTPNENLRLIPSAIDFAKVLIGKGLIDANGITEKGDRYLEKYPIPKVKYPELFNMTGDDWSYLIELNKSELDWTPSNRLAKKASMLFKLVRKGYAVGMKNRDGVKLSKNNIMPTPSIYFPTTRDRYFFKITKKGKSALKGK